MLNMAFIFSLPLSIYVKKKTPKPKALLLDGDFDGYRWNIKPNAIKIIHMIAFECSLLNTLLASHC